MSLEQGGKEPVLAQKGAVPVQGGKEPVVDQKGAQAQRVPCWILFTLSHNIQPEGEVSSGTATTSMKVG